MRTNKPWIVLVLAVAALLALIWYRNSQTDVDQQEQHAAYRSPDNRRLPEPLPLPDSDKSALDDSPDTFDHAESGVAAEHSGHDGSSNSDGNSDQHPLDPVLDWARRIQQKLHSDLVDYTATVVKRERIKGKLQEQETMRVKFRNPRPNASPPIPTSVYLKFIPPSPNAGREVMWVENRDQGRLQSYQFGIPVALDPTGLLAMRGNKYPITELGIVKLVEKLIEKGEHDKAVGDCQVEIIDNQSVAGRNCTLIEVIHATPDSRYDFHIAQIFIDKELDLPIRYAAYLWPDSPNSAAPLEEEYTYQDLQINVGLTDLDFDTTNPQYNFP